MKGVCCALQVLLLLVGCKGRSEESSARPSEDEKKESEAQMRELRRLEGLDSPGEMPGSVADQPAPTAAESLAPGWAFAKMADQQYFCFVYEDPMAGPSGKCQLLEDDTPDSALQELATKTTGEGKTTLRLAGVQLKRLKADGVAHLGLPAQPEWASIFVDKKSENQGEP